jgi:hypothetical protein
MRGIQVHKLMCDPYNKQRKSLFFLSGRMFGSVKYVGQSLVEVSVRYPIFFCVSHGLILSQSISTRFTVV